MAVGGITLWGASQLLGDFFSRSVDWPATMHFAVTRNVAPGPFTEGGELDEPDAALGYLRVPILSSVNSWRVDSEVISNVADIVFPAALDSWGLIRYFAISNAPTGGQLYFYGDLGEAVPTEATDVLTVPSGVLSISLGPIFTGLSSG